MADPLRSIPWHAIFVFLIPMLGMVVQMHYPSSSPLHERPVNMWIFMVFFLIYCLAIGYYFKSWKSSSANATYRNISVNVALISGYMACGALISVLVPHSLEPLVFFICLMLLFLYFACNPLIQTYKNVISFVKNKWKGTESHDEPAAADIDF